MRLIFRLLLMLNASAVGVAVLIVVYRGVNPFEEGGFITILSVFQLLAISILSYEIFRFRDAVRSASLWKSSHVVWAIIALGFVLLTADELFQIHERLDHLIHHVLDMRETGLTDRIDDVLVGVYGLVGIGLLMAYREEMRTCRARPSLFIIGFFLLFTMVALDVLTNRIDILAALFEIHLAAFLQFWLSLAEDSVKIFSEMFFILGFYAILQQVKYKGGEQAGGELQANSKNQTD